MSRRSSGSEVLGRYYTDPRVARAIVRALKLHPRMIVLEPSAGGGSFLDALLEVDQERELGLLVHAMDADPGAPALRPGGRVATCCADFLDAGAWPGWAPPDLIVGNPPYSVERQEVAAAHVQRALELVADGGTVAYLLRVGFLGSRRRLPFWLEHPPDEVRVLVPRPGFTGKGNDSDDYALFTWKQRWWSQGPNPALGWLDTGTDTDRRSA